MSLRTSLATMPLMMGAIAAAHADDPLCGNGQTGYQIVLPNGGGVHTGICNVGNTPPTNGTSTTITITQPSNTTITPPLVSGGLAPSGTTINLPSTPTLHPSGTVVNAPNDFGIVPNGTGMAIATVNVANLVGNNIMSRVTGGTGSGISTGDTMNSKHMWAQGFGNFANQQSKGGIAGYQANTGGMTLGMDTDELVEGATFGAAVSYANSSVDGRTSNASTDANSYMVSLYASKDYSSGFYIAGQAGLGFNTYDSQRRASGATTDTTADFDSYQYTGRIDAGVNLPFAYGITFTPLASAQFTHLALDGYTEQGPSALQVDKSSFDTADLGIGAKLAWDWTLDNGYTLQPNIRAKYIYTVGDRSLVTTNRFVGNGMTFTSQGVEADNSALSLGTGLQIVNVQDTEITLDYDADLRASMIGHALQVKVRMPF